MNKNKPAKNQLCPCGSGKKYKRCCGKSNFQPIFSDTESIVVLDELDKCSNRIVDLLELENFEEAERLCHELMHRFPETIDWRERFAQLYEAKGDLKQAINYYRQAADFALSHNGFDQEYISWLLEKAALHNKENERRK